MFVLGHVSDGGSFRATASFERSACSSEASVGSLEPYSLYACFDMYMEVVFYGGLASRRCLDASSTTHDAAEV